MFSLTTHAVLINQINFFVFSANVMCLSAVISSCKLTDVISLTISNGTVIEYSKRVLSISSRFSTELYQALQHKRDIMSHLVKSHFHRRHLFLQRHVFLVDDAALFLRPLLLFSFGEDGVEDEGGQVHTGTDEKHHLPFRLRTLKIKYQNAIDNALRQK